MKVQFSNQNIIKKHPVKATLIFLTVLFIGLSFADEKWVGKLSLMFTAIASVATVATLVIAIMLYDRFGLKNLFINRQADKVFELIDLLASGRFNIRRGRGIYLIQLNIRHLEMQKLIPDFAIDKGKHIVFGQANFELFFQQLSPLKDSKWMPKIVADALEFLDFAMIAEVDLNSANFVFLTIKSLSTPEDWVQPLPEITLEQFINNLINLAQVLDQWVSEHSAVHLKLNLKD